jgi:hypothetical protein
MPASATDHRDQEIALRVNPRFLRSVLFVLSVATFSVTVLSPALFSVAVLSVAVLAVAPFRVSVMFVAPLHV